jgi:hypothetical protein
MPPAASFALGAALGILASPCALGGVAFAASLRAVAPAAALGTLCTAGIVDVYALRSRHVHRCSGDPWAYAALSAAGMLVAARGGASLVHPRIAPALALASIYCAMCAWRTRRESMPAMRAIAAVVLAAVIVGAPAPVYRATETTISGAFAGELVDFTGVATYDRGHSALVRYAITCCRADAAPVVLAIDRSTAHVQGRWLHASGVFEQSVTGLRLRVRSLSVVAAPSDPFVYR